MKKSALAWVERKKKKETIGSVADVIIKGGSSQGS
jgi:hypothetical protein